MPWQHCEADLADDVTECPSCGTAKATWTLQWNQTREFRVTRATVVNVELVNGADEPVEGERYEATFADESTVEGTLDDLGKARIEASAAGLVTLCFPDQPAGRVELLGEPEASEEAEADYHEFVVGVQRPLRQLARPFLAALTFVVYA